MADSNNPQKMRVYMTFSDGVNLGCAIWIGMMVGSVLLSFMFLVALFFFGSVLGGFLEAFTNDSLIMSIIW